MIEGKRMRRKQVLAGIFGLLFTIVLGVWGIFIDFDPMTRGFSLGLLSALFIVCLVALFTGLLKSPPRIFTRFKNSNDVAISIQVLDKNLGTLKKGEQI